MPKFNVNSKMGLILKIVFILFYSIFFLVILLTSCGVISIKSLTSGGGDNSSSESASHAETTTPADGTAELSAPEMALELLKEGNLRYMENKLEEADNGKKKRKELYDEQQPFAIIIGCSDSRVPPEIVFDQGLGDLFVVRVAGNVVDEDVLASVEYAVEHLEVPLIVVLGHERCGAVQAAYEAITDNEVLPGSLGSLVEEIRPAVDVAIEESVDVKQTIIEKAVRENVYNVIDELEMSPIIAKKLEDDELVIQGAKYYLETGEVDWLD